MRPAIVHRCRSLVISCIVLLLGAGAAQSQEATSQGSHTLRSAIAYARHNNPEIQAQEFEVRKAKLEVDKIWQTTHLPSLDLDFRTGAVPEARGDIFSSPDKAEDLDGWGAFYQVDVGLVQPVYTFGKTASATRAARGGVDVAESGKQVANEQLTFRVVQTYWGLLSAQRGLSLAANLREDYDQLLSRVREELEKPDSDLDDTDLLEVRILEFDVEKAHRESLALTQTARRQLALLLGLDDDANFNTADLASPDFLLATGQVDDLSERAERFNPELKKLSAGLAALDAQVDLASSKHYPDVFVRGGFRWGQAGNRTDQTNPFVVDNFNYRSLGGLVGLRWDLDFLGHRNEVQQGEAGRDALDRRRDLLEGKLGAEVAELFAEAQSGFDLLQAAEVSVDAARTWLRVSFDNWDLGIGEIDRLLKAHQAFYRYRAIEIEQEFRYNESLARLALAIGDADRYVDWIDDGRVTLD